MSRLAAVALAGALLAASLFAASRRGVWDPDEPRYAQVARETRGVVPHLNGTVYASKPPLVFWMMRAAGDTPFAARVPSAIAGVIVFGGTFLLGLRLLGGRGALRGGLALLGCGQFLWQSTFGQLDQVLAAFEVSGLACLVLATFPVTEEEKGVGGRVPVVVRGPLAAIGLALLGLGVLAKGPVSVIVPGLALLTFALAVRSVPRLRWAWLGLLVGLLPAVVWIVAAWAVAGTDYVTRILFGETIVRYVSADAHREWAFVFWGKFLAGVLPVGVFLIPAVIEAIRAEWHAHRFKVAPVDRLPTLLPLAWLASSLVFFSFSSGKRGVYMVPTYPAVALLVGWYFDREAGSRGKAARILEEIGGWGLVVTGALAYPAVEIGSNFVPWGNLGIDPFVPRIEAALLSLVLLGSGVLALRRSRASLPVIGLATMVIFIVGHVRIVPELDPWKSAARTTFHFLAEMPPGAEWCMLGEPQEGILYYSQRPAARFKLDAPGLAGFREWMRAREGRPRFVVLKGRNIGAAREAWPGLVRVREERIGGDLVWLVK